MNNLDYLFIGLFIGIVLMFILLIQELFGKYSKIKIKKLLYILFRGKNE
jgi:uncharacterized membrane protein